MKERQSQRFRAWNHPPVRILCAAVSAFLVLAACAPRLHGENDQSTERPLHPGPVQVDALRFRQTVRSLGLADAVDAN